MEPDANPLKREMPRSPRTTESEKPDSLPVYYLERGCSMCFHFSSANGHLKLEACVGNA